MRMRLVTVESGCFHNALWPAVVLARLMSLSFPLFYAGGGGLDHIKIIILM